MHRRGAGAGSGRGQRQLEGWAVAHQLPPANYSTLPPHPGPCSKSPSLLETWRSALMGLAGSQAACAPALGRPVGHGHSVEAQAQSPGAGKEGSGLRVPARSSLGLGSWRELVHRCSNLRARNLRTSAGFWGEGRFSWSRQGLWGVRGA